MFRNYAHASTLLFLLLMIPPQVVIWIVVLRWAKPRISDRALRALKLTLTVIAIPVLLNFVPQLSTRLTFFVWSLPFWPRLSPLLVRVETVTYFWALASPPAFLTLLLYRWLLNRTPREVNPGRRQLIHAAGSLALTAPFAVEAFGAFVQRWQFQVQEVPIPVKDLPHDLEGLRILQISDVHLSPFLSEAEFAKVIDASNELRPHVALMTGDLISEMGDPLGACLRQLGRLRSDAGTFGSLGNHEKYCRVEEITTREGARLGVRFLRHENQPLRFGNATLNFAGIDYQPFKLRGRYLQGVDRLKMPGAVNILLSHNPDVFDEAAQQGWDATLAGHTHGGQVTVEILNQTLNFARFYTRYVSGFYRHGDATCYVTRGIGTIGIPARLGATPEITLLKLRKA